MHQRLKLHKQNEWLSDFQKKDEKEHIKEKDMIQDEEDLKAEEGKK